MKFVGWVCTISICMLKRHFPTEIGWSGPKECSARVIAPTRYFHHSPFPEHPGSTAIQVDILAHKRLSQLREFVAGIWGKQLSISDWVCNLGGFAFVTLNIALNNIQHATHRPSIRTGGDKKCSIKHYKSKTGTVTYPPLVEVPWVVLSHHRLKT